MPDADSSKHSEPLPFSDRLHDLPEAITGERFPSDLRTEEGAWRHYLQDVRDLSARVDELEEILSRQDAAEKLADAINRDRVSQSPLQARQPYDMAEELQQAHEAIEHIGAERDALRALNEDLTGQLHTLPTYDEARAMQAVVDAALAKPENHMQWMHNLCEACDRYKEAIGHDA